MLRIQCLFDPWIWDPGWEKNQDPDLWSGMNNRGHISESLETIFRVKILTINSLMLIRNPRIFLNWIRDGKISDPGTEINIPDPQHCWYYLLIAVCRLHQQSLHGGQLLCQGVLNIFLKFLGKYAVFRTVLWVPIHWIRIRGFDD